MLSASSHGAFRVQEPFRRQREIDRLSSLLGSAAAGQIQPGIGKTRLIGKRVGVVLDPDDNPVALATTSFA